MKALKKLLALSLALGLTLSFTGCSMGDKTVYFDTACGLNTVFKIGDMKCSKKEALVYLMNAKNIYGSVDGVNLWSEDFDTETITDSLKDACLDHLTRVYTLDIYAEEQKIELSDAEKQECQDAAKEYYESLTDEEKDFCSVKKKDIEKMYEHYYLAEKIYTDLMNSVDEEVSEDEARVMDAYVLFVSSKEKADEIQGMIDYGYTFERLAATYTELDTYQVTFARNEYPQEVDDVVFNLDTDEVSDAIEADDGYYFFQCLDKYDEELSEANKSVIIEKRRKQVLEDIISQVENQYYSNMNTKLWDSITLDAEQATDLTSGSFFSVLSTYTKSSGVSN